jgi:transposase
MWPVKAYLALNSMQSACGLFPSRPRSVTRWQMGLVERDDGWRIPDSLWRELEPLIPAGKAHPLGCHNPRVPNRAAMNAILFVLRTGCQWNALNATGICSSSSAHRRFLEWTAAGVFERAWAKALSTYDEFVGVDWSWLSMDGAMTKAPLGGEKNGAQPDGSWQAWHEAERADGRGGSTARPLRRWRQSCRLQDGT